MTTQAVLRAMLEDPTAEKYGLELSATTGLPSGTLYPILARLENVDWVDSRWEDIDIKAEGRPRRRYYRLNANGLAAARSALAAVDAQRARLATRWRPLEGTS